MAVINKFKVGATTYDIEDTVTKNSVANLKNTIKAVTVTLSASGWSASAPYTQTVSVSGMTSTWEAGFTSVVPSGNVETDKIANGNFAKLTYISTSTNAMTFTCVDEKPDANITLKIDGRVV